MELDGEFLLHWVLRWLFLVLTQLIWSMYVYFSQLISIGNVHSLIHIFHFKKQSNRQSFDMSDRKDAYFRCKMCFKVYKRTDSCMKGVIDLCSGCNSNVEYKVCEYCNWDKLKKHWKKRREWFWLLPIFSFNSIHSIPDVRKSVAAVEWPKIGRQTMTECFRCSAPGFYHSLTMTIRIIWNSNYRKTNRIKSSEQTLSWNGVFVNRASSPASLFRCFMNSNLWPFLAIKCKPRNLSHLLRSVGLSAERINRFYSMLKTV